MSVRKSALTSNLLDHSESNADGRITAVGVHPGVQRMGLVCAVVFGAMMGACIQRQIDGTHKVDPKMAINANAKAVDSLVEADDSGAGLNLAGDPYVNVSQVDPPVFGSLRFSNDCFWRKKTSIMDNMLKRYKKKVSSYADDGGDYRYKGQHRKEVSDTEFHDACNRWVAQSTDAAWHSADKRDRDLAVDKYFAKDFKSNVFGWASGGMKQLRGAEAIKTLINEHIERFPDWKIRILNTQCTPAFWDPFGMVGFFTAMPDISTGTLYGDPTKKTATMGLAVTFVAVDPHTHRWQYQEESVVHTDDTLNALLGRDAFEKLYNATPESQKAMITSKFSALVDACYLPDTYELWEHSG